MSRIGRDRISIKNAMHGIGITTANAPGIWPPSSPTDATNVGSRYRGAENAAQSSARAIKVADGVRA
jgi:hypothetical protein